MAEFKDMVEKIVKDATGLKEVDLEIPPDMKMGDFAFPCFVLSKKMKKSPVDIAKDLASNIKMKKPLKEVKATGPYLNFFFEKEEVASSVLNEVLKLGDNYGKGKDKKKLYMVEFFHANTHKGVHIGHVRNISLGSAFCRLLECCGYKIKRVNYEGDIGPHVAKCLWGYLNIGEKPPKTGKERWLGEIYSKANAREKEDDKVKEEIKEINRQLYLGKDKKLMDLWKKTRQWCLDDFENIYDEFGFKYDRLYFESEVEKRGIEIAKEMLKKGIARESEGALIVDLEEYNLGVYVLLTSDGHAVYHTKDLALAELKVKENKKIDMSIHVVGKEQELYFKQLFKTFELIKSPLAGKSYHMIYELVMLPEGKMSSREGNVVLYYDLVHKLYQEALKGVSERHKDWSKKDKEKSAHDIAFGALKFGMLSKENNRRILFDWDKALDFEGDTGPYLQYSHARICSILAKSGKFFMEQDFSLLTADPEMRLVKLIGDFKHVVEKSASSYKVHLVANYLLELCHAFNVFYHECNILNEKKELMNARLVLITCVKQVLANGLGILGISAMEKM